MPLPHRLVRPLPTGPGCASFLPRPLPDAALSRQHSPLAPCEHGEPVRLGPGSKPWTAPDVRQANSDGSAPGVRGFALCALVPDLEKWLPTHLEI